MPEEEWGFYVKMVLIFKQLSFNQSRLSLNEVCVWWSVIWLDKGEIMENLILTLFIIIIVSLNILFFILAKKGKLSLIVSGIIMIVLGPVFGFSSGALFLHFYDWSSGGTGEGAGYGGAFLGIITIANGGLILVIGMFKWMISFFNKSY